MEWWMIVGFASVVAIATAFLAVSMGARAPALARATNEAGWKVECARCHAISGAGDAGMVRIGAASCGKRTLLKCPACARRSMMRVFKDGSTR